MQVTNVHVSSWRMQPSKQSCHSCADFCSCCTTSDNVFAAPAEYIASYTLIATLSWLSTSNNTRELRKSLFWIQVVAQLKAADCEEVEVLLDSKRLSFRSSKSKSMMNETEVSLFPEASGGKLCLYAENDAEVRARYSFRHLQRVGRLCKAGCKVLFQMADDAPLSIVCDLTQGGACQLFLAPLIE